MKPIPESAKTNDPFWSVHYQQLALGLIEENMRMVTVSYFTGISKRHASRIFQAINPGETPPGGALSQGEPRFYAIPGKNTSYSWVLQGAIFLECYDRMTKIVDYPLNKGWLLLHAYRAYIAQTQKLVDALPATKRLDINQAFALLGRISYMDPKLARISDLQRHTCTSCSVTYLMATSAERDTQRCPVCSINNHALSRGEQVLNMVRRKSQSSRLAA